MKTIFSKTLTLGLFTLCLAACTHKNTYTTVLSEARQREIQQFAKILERNAHEVDSINKAVNHNYNYPFPIQVTFYQDNDIYKTFTYYGMSNGYKAFIYNLHTKHIINIKLAYTFSRSGERYNITTDLNTLQESINNHPYIFFEEPARITLYKYDKHQTLIDAYAERITESKNKESNTRDNYWLNYKHAKRPK